MNIELKNISKRYNNRWIFKNLNWTFENGSKTIISGPNGSGKSTLSKIVYGYATCTKGEVIRSLNGKKIEAKSLYQYVSYCSPSMFLEEQFTLKETLQFLCDFKTPSTPISIEEMAEKLMLKPHLEDKVASFSSGMLQRLKLGLCLFPNSPLIIMDEPCSHLDAIGLNWYDAFVQTYARDKTILICSNNHPIESKICTKELKIEDYK